MKVTPPETIRRYERSGRSLTHSHCISCFADSRRPLAARHIGCTAYFVMKTSIWFLALASVFLVRPAAQAADDDVVIDRTIIHQSEVEPSKFKEEAFGIK